MLRQLLRSKIHRAVITDACLDYEGSLTVDEALLDAAGIVPYELVTVSNLQNGERFTTYAMNGRRGSGDVVLNGPAARKGVVGDRVIIFCYHYYDEDEVKHHQPTVIRVDDRNRILPRA